jgi:hypothetical protein
MKISLLFPVAVAMKNRYRAAGSAIPTTMREVAVRGGLLLVTLLLAGVAHATPITPPPPPNAPLDWQGTGIVPPGGANDITVVWFNTINVVPGGPSPVGPGYTNLWGYVGPVISTPLSTTSGTSTFNSTILTDAGTEITWDLDVDPTYLVGIIEWWFTLDGKQVGVIYGPDTVTPTTPEPATSVLVGTGLVCLAGAMRRKLRCG